jgi:hypothetical protein
MGNILYLSCHSVLEAEEISLFHELGCEVFSPGAYTDPKNPGSTMRPAILDQLCDPSVVEQWHRDIAGKNPGKDGKEHLTKEFVDLFDAVVVMHLPRWIELNWDVMKHKRVIWRTIGQSIASTEQQMRPYRDQGMEIVRYSPREERIPGYIGQDAMIRFYKDPDEYGPWTGEEKQVINFTQSMRQREPFCGWGIFEESTRPFKRRLFGPGNEGLDWSTGEVSYSQLKEELCKARCYFYTGTHPASYTLNFLEAGISGTPLVCVGSKYGNSRMFQGHDLYEIPDIIENGVNGFISDSKMEFQFAINSLFSDYALAKSISEKGRETIIKLFGKETIKQQWKQYLDK